MADPTDLNIEQITSDVLKSLASVEWQTWGTAAFYVLVGFIVAGFISTMAGRVLSKYTSLHYTIIIKRLLYYGIIILSVLLAMAALQINMKVLGIATVLTLAIGFASQTAVSNIISGLFLVFERPFSVGDHVEFDGISGELLSIDLLSIKVRTFDNTLIRIPNETLLKTHFTNLTKFPIRRFEVKLRFDMQEDIPKVKQILFELASKNKSILESPQAELFFNEFSESAMILTFAVWLKTSDFSALKNSIPCDIQKAFKENGIVMPTNQYLAVGVK